MSLKEITKALNKKVSKLNPDMVFNPEKMIERVSSGDYIVDAVSGGGFPRGRLTEIFGLEHSGKTSLLMQAYAGVLNKGGAVVHFDFENAWDANYAQKVYGIDPMDDNFIIYSPTTIEEGDIVFDGLSKIEGLKVDMLGFDSVAAMLPAQLIESPVDKASMGLHARAMGLFVPKAKNFAQEKDCAVVFLNQYRCKIITNPYEKNMGMAAGVGSYSKYAPTGGNALRFWTSLRLVLEHKGSMVYEMENKLSGKPEKIKVANEIMIENIKNKCSQPFMKGTTIFSIPNVAGQKGGWDLGRTLIQILKNKGNIVQAGSKFTYKGKNIKFESSVGKLKAEAIFCSRLDLLEDAKELIDISEVLESFEPVDIPDDLIDISIGGEEYEEIVPQEITLEKCEEVLENHAVSIKIPRK